MSLLAKLYEVTHLQAGMGIGNGFSNPAYAFFLYFLSWEVPEPPARQQGDGTGFVPGRKLFGGALRKKISQEKIPFAFIPGQGALPSCCSTL